MAGPVKPVQEEIPGKDTNRKMSGSPQSEPANPWARAEEDLYRTLAVVGEAAVRYHREWRDSIESLFEEWRIALTELASRHARHVETLRSDLPESGQVPRPAISDYRASVTRELLQQLVEVKSKNRPPVDVTDRFRALVDGLTALPDRLPESVRLLEPPSLYRRQDEDSTWTLLRKTLQRGRISGSEAIQRTSDLVARVFRRPPPSRLPASRIVPARQLTAYHLRHDLIDLLAAEHADAHSALVDSMSELERLLAAWINGVLVVARAAEPEPEAAGKQISWDALPAPLVEEQQKVETTGEEESNQEERSNATAEESSDDSSPRDELLMQAESLQAGLEDLAAQVEAPEPVDRSRMDEVFESLSRDFEKAGTLLLSLSDRPAVEEPPALRSIDRTSSRWHAWHEEFHERVDYYLHLMRLRDKLVALERGLVRRVATATVDPVLTTFADMSRRLDGVREAAVDRADVARKKQDPSLLTATLEQSSEDLVGFVQSVFKHLPGLVSSDQSLSDPGRAEWDDLCRFTDRLPERIRLHGLRGETAGRAGSKRIEIDVRQLVRDVLEPPLPDRLRRAAEQLRSAVRRVWTETEQVQHIVQYNLDAAFDELTGDGPDREESASGNAVQGGEPSEALEEKTPVDSAESLVIDGLGRAVMTLSHLAATLRPAWSNFVETVNEEFRQDWTDVHRRLHTAETAEEQWAGFRAKLSRRFDRISERSRLAWSSVKTTAARLFTVGRRRAESLIKIGQTAVGVLDSNEAVRYETIDALSAVKALQQKLPLIYRRLFSFEPLDEMSLLEGRARDLVWVEQHYSRWKDSHQMGVLLIRAPLGSGRTSFLNALDDTLFSDCTVCQINLRERIYHADEFAARIAGELGYGEESPTIDELEERLMHSPRSEPPQICMIDNFEHLVLRAPGGSESLERIILFLSRTDRSIYWIGTVGTHTWQYLSKTAATAVGFVDSYQLTPLDRDAVESLVINRHRRSGMSLNFTVSEDASALLRQRLKRARSPEQQQELAREEYFDRLWRASGQTIMLALYHWIRSAQFSDDQSTLTVQPLKPLRFDFLNDLPLEQAFTLKAFFLHKTLSLSAHSRIFHISDAESTAILESLLNSHIIEEVPLSERHPREDYHISRDAIYRIKPLLIHPVTSYLQSKNIVY